jgi:hypothetical protein
MRAGQDAALYLLRRPARWEEREERGERATRTRTRTRRASLRQPHAAGGPYEDGRGERKPCRRDGLGTYSTRDGGESEGPWHAVEGAGVVSQTG